MLYNDFYLSAAEGFNYTQSFCIHQSLLRCFNGVVCLFLNIDFWFFFGILLAHRSPACRQAGLAKVGCLGFLILCIPAIV